LVGIYGAAKLDRLHPVDAGVLRLRRRALRRPGLPPESAWRFYSRTVSKWIKEQVGYGRLIAEMMVIDLGLLIEQKRRGLDHYALEQATSC
jgi:hypothetical protein